MPRNHPSYIRRRDAAVQLDAVLRAADAGQSGDLWARFPQHDLARLHSPFPAILRED